MVKEYTHRFKCWAKSINKSPETAIERDDEGTPLNFYEFSLWIQECWKEWRKLNGFGRNDPVWGEHHNRFDVWLGHKVGLETS